MKEINEQRKMIEAQIGMMQRETEKMADQFNHHLVALKLQDPDRTSEETNGKYRRGVHIRMKIDGRLENDFEILRDVAPIVDDLKLKWRGRLQELSDQKSQLSQEMVQLDVTRMNLQD